MATISKRVTAKGEVHWRAQVRLRGYPPASKTFPRRTDAVAWAAKTMGDLRRGLYLPEEVARRHTLAETLEAYTAHRAALGRPLDRQRATQLAWWEAQLGQYALAEITPARLAKVRDQLMTAGLAASGRPVGPATAVRYLAALSHVFSFAERELGWVSANPVRRVTRPREPQGRVRYLDREAELPRLLAAVSASADRRLGPLVVLALATGARQGELLGLRWRDLDLARGFATLNRTKNRDRRALVLTPPAVAALAELRKGKAFGNDLLFADAKGRRSFPRKAWLAALREAGIGDLRFHDLRHCAASYLAMSGASLSEIAEILGHRTLAMVKRYSHLSPTHLRGVVQRMTERYLPSASAGREGAR